MNFAVGLLFAGVFCLSSGAYGYLPSGEVYPASEMVFIDPSVQDAEIIVAQLPQGAEVVRLSPGMDAVAQISAHLVKKRDLSAIRIISHGNPGHFVLNGKRIDGYFLRDHEDRISAWGRALAENGDILVYACNLAASHEGQTLVQQISGLTGADVAAATSAMGGLPTTDHGSVTTSSGWDLDYQFGEIESASLTVDGYEYHLADRVVTNNNDSGAGSLRLAILEVGDGDSITFDANYTITLASQLTVSKSMTITGRGAANTIIQANAAKNTATYRVFEITSGTVTLENMTIRYGNPLEGHGGGIYNAATLNINNSTICNNRSYRTEYKGQGGGIYNSSTLTINNSTVNGNTQR